MADQLSLQAGRVTVFQDVDDTTAFTVEVTKDGTPVDLSTSTWADPDGLMTIDTTDAANGKLGLSCGTQTGNQDWRLQADGDTTYLQGTLVVGSTRHVGAGTGTVSVAVEDQTVTVSAVVPTHNHDGVYSTNKTVVDVRRDAAQTIPNATVTAVTLDNEVLDPLGYVDLATNPTRITVPASGAGIRHRFVFAVGFAGNATGRRQYKLLKNGTTSLAMTELEPPGSQPWRWDTTWEETPAEGDYYELMVYQSSGGTLDTRNASSGQNPTVFIEQLTT